MKAIKKFQITHPSKFSLKDHDPAYTDGYTSQEEANEEMSKDIIRLVELQERLFAGNQYSVLIILQAMDAAGKDGVIKHVMSGLNPQGCVVQSFKHPTDEEYDHDYFWRINKALPGRGQIGIFNRSYYENVLICKVHPELILNEKLPGINSVDKVDKDFWQKRYKQINAFERTLRENGTIILKFFLHLSKDEQRDRLLRRIDNPDKHWKFQYSDINEREYWKQYQHCYEDMIEATSTPTAPWYVIPADNKWYTRTSIANILVQSLEGLDLKFPVISDEEKAKLEEGRAKLV